MLAQQFPKLFYFQKGTGCPVLLIHAFPLNHKMWFPQINGLSKFCRVIAPDLPGFGLSGRMPNPSMGGMAQSLAQLLERMKIRKPVFVVGLSMGGYVALEFAERYPHKTRGLALLATRAGADTSEQGEKRRDVATEVLRHGIPFVQKKILPKLLGDSALKNQPEVLLQLEKIVSRNYPDGIADALYAMARRKDFSKKISKIKCPVLISAGSEDVVIPIKEARSMAAALKFVDLRLVEGVGHLMNFEQPKLMNLILTRFIRAQIG